MVLMTREERESRALSWWDKQTTPFEQLTIFDCDEGGGG